MQLTNRVVHTVKAKGKRVGIVVARFNEEMTSGLLVSAKEALRQSGVKEKDVKVVSVAGSMEIPYALMKLAQSKKFHCLVALGCVIRGETPHFDYVCKTAQEGVLKVSLDYHIPIGFGVMTVNSIEQAKERMHLGEQAVFAALELVFL